jgi:K+-transporting ATPase A subunit
VHHAAFIAVLSLFVLVFGVLHYFPQLQHGT